MIIAINRAQVLQSVKTIMIVDEAVNCAYDCFLATEHLFAAVFPGEGQDIEFIEDFLSRRQGEELDQEFSSMWKRPVLKQEVCGIDGILFYGLLHKKKFYPNERNSDLDGSGRQLVRSS